MTDTSDPLVHVVRPEPATRAGAVTEGQGQERREEVGGRRDGTEPTRFGDWEKHGRCIDF